MSDSAPPSVAAEPPRRRRARRRLYWVAVALLALGAAVVVWLPDGAPAADGPGARGARGGGAGAPVPVGVATARSGRLDIHLDALGTVVPLAGVTVRSRVDGQLLRVNFTEGQSVRAGTLLAEIDPRPFRVQLEQAKGQLARDQALLANAIADQKRYKILLAQDSIAKQQLDAQDSLVRQYQAALQVDQAAIDAAQLQLDYARITAPIGGRLGLRLVDPGNMIAASDTTGIVTITQLEPIAATFAIPEDRAPAVLAKLRAGLSLAVEARDRAGRKLLASGRLLTADNQIDPETGTLKLKAEFPNADGALYPNQFVNVRLHLDTRPDATLIPTAAVGRSQQGAYVWVLDEAGKVAQRPIEPGPEQGDDSSVTSGLAPGERVVIDGLDRLRAGTQVEPVARTQPGDGGGAATAPASAGGDATPAAPAPAASAAAGGERPHRRARDGAAQ